MKKSFPTLWTSAQEGFISIPILIIAILGTMVVGGGGYAVYKVNQIEKESASRVTELERKFEEVSKPATTTEEFVENIATTTETMSTSSDEVIKEDEAEFVATNPIQILPTVVPQTVSQPTSVDVCANLGGLQATVPEGYKLSGVTCEEIEDKCTNIVGIQEIIPSGMLLTKEYGCISQQELDEMQDSEREAEQLVNKCNELKETVYELGQKILDVEEEYRLKALAISSAGGQSVSQANAQINQIYRQQDAEIAPLELERSKANNEYAYLCN